MSKAAVSPQTGPGRELYVRHARVDGQSVARLRAVDQGQQCVVEVEVWPDEGHTSERAGSYTFPSPAEATQFVTHAVETLIALGCEVRSS